MRVLAFAAVAATLSAPRCLGAFLAVEKRTFQSLAICLSDYSWEDNRNDISPCYLAAVVLGSCQGYNWTLQAVNGSLYYSTTIVNLCSCSWAAYNLLSACALCQGSPQSVVSWPFYSTNCSDHLSQSYFPSQIAVPNDTLLPYYATLNPATAWNGQRFNLDQFHAIVSEGHADVLIGPQKKSTHVGAIVGGIIGGLAVLVVLGLALFYRRRLVGRPTLSNASHVRLPSDTTQITSGTSLGRGYQGMNNSFVTSAGTAISPRSESDARSYFGSVAHSEALYSSVSPPQRAASPPQANTQSRNRQDIVVPFSFPSDPTRQQESKEDRERADRVITPAYNVPRSPTPNSLAVGPSASNDDLPSRRRINPPAYTDVAPTAPRPATPVTHTSANSTRSESPMAVQMPSYQVFRPFVENPGSNPF